MLAIVLTSLLSLAHADERVLFDGQTRNVDGSSTFTGLKVQRGDLEYELDAKYTRPHAVCRMLGFEAALESHGLNTTDANGPSYWTLLFLNEDGTFKKTANSDVRWTKVTCFNAGELRPATDFDRKVNSDGSTTLTNLRHLRGDQAYEIDAKYTAFEAICRLAGYEHALVGDGLHLTDVNGPAYWNLAKIHAAGAFHSTISSDVRVTKTTCYSGAEPTLIVIVDGVRYRRQ